MDWILANKLNLFNIATAVVALASVVSAITPNVQDDSVVAKLRKLLDIIAFNVGFAQNKTDKKD
jgi:hypothetical protein